MKCAADTCKALAANSNQPCDDQSLCTTNDLCRAGTCQGTLTSCPRDTCSVGVCEPATGLCTHESRPDGLTCDDGKFCTEFDRCVSGVCAGVARECGQASADGCKVGSCVEATRFCGQADVPNGTACNDNSICTSSDVCQQGLCRGASMDCTELNDTCHIGVCDGFSGQCVAKPALGSSGCTTETPKSCGCESGPSAPGMLLCELLWAVQNRRKSIAST